MLHTEMITNAPLTFSPKLFRHILADAAKTDFQLYSPSYLTFPDYGRNWIRTSDPIDVNDVL